MVAQIEKLRPFPEVPEALARLKGRYRLIVLSNGDPDMLQTAKQHHGIAFDDVISVAVANALKPHVATYTKAAELAGVPMVKCCSSPTTHLIALGPNPQACAQLSLTADGAHSECPPPAGSAGIQHAWACRRHCLKRLRPNQMFPSVWISRPPAGIS
jgi:FMN phosphatase YigB (HAD superfamily)